MKSDLDSTWRETRWGEVAELAYGKALRERVPDGRVIVFGTNGPTGRTDQKLGDGPTVVIGRKGAYRGVHYAPGPFWVIDTAFFLLPSAEVDMGWAYYELLTHDINGLDSGSAIPSTRREDFYAMPVRLPPLPEQQRVASLLRTLDDKIDSNRRLVSLLEETAATIFRARFVDFVGTEEFAESETGPVPLGWKVAPIGDVLRVVGGSTPSTKEPRFWNGTHCWATPKDLAGARSPILLDTERHITDAGVNGISSKLLPPRTVLLSSRAPVGYTAISFVEVAVNQGFIAIPPSDSMPSEYVLLWLREHMAEIKAHAGGTTFAEISKRAFRPLPMVVPPTEQLQEFGDITRPLFDLMVARETEMRTLSRVRGALLPKLFSGKIRVPDPTDADEVIGSAGEELAAAP